MKYGLFKKNGWQALLITETKEEAEEHYQRSKYKHLIEVREIIDDEVH